MVIERQNNETIIRIPDNDEAFGAKELQQLLDYLRYRQIVNQSMATQEDADKLADEADSSWWQANRNRILGK